MLLQYSFSLSPLVFNTTLTATPPSVLQAALRSLPLNPMASLKHQSVVKDEKKANAITMYFQSQTNRKLEIIVHLFNAFAALFLFSRYPLFQAFYAYSLALFLPLSTHPFYAFLLLNSIILSLYALSNHNNTGNNSKDHVYGEFLSNTKTTARAAVNVPEEFTAEKQSVTVTALDYSSDDKPVTMSSEVGESPVFNGTVTAVTTRETTTTTTCCTTTSGDAVSEQKCFRRVRSESFERRMVVAGGGPELRKVKTALSRQAQGRFCHVEQLNKEEFNRTVEDFIAKQKRILWEESNKKEHLAY